MNGYFEKGGKKTEEKSQAQAHANNHKEPRGPSTFAHLPPPMCAFADFTLKAEPVTRFVGVSKQCRTDFHRSDQQHLQPKVRHPFQFLVACYFI